MNWRCVGTIAPSLLVWRVAVALTVRFSVWRIRILEFGRESGRRLVGERSESIKKKKLRVPKIAAPSDIRHRKRVRQLAIVDPLVAKGVLGRSFRLDSVLLPYFIFAAAKKKFRKPKSSTATCRLQTHLAPPTTHING